MSTPYVYIYIYIFTDVYIYIFTCVYCVHNIYYIFFFLHEYRTKLGRTKVVLRGSWSCHHCKTDKGPPYWRMSLRPVPNFVRNSYNISVIVVTLITNYIFYVHFLLYTLTHLFGLIVRPVFFLAWSFAGQANRQNYFLQMTRVCQLWERYRAGWFCSSRRSDPRSPWHRRVAGKKGSPMSYQNWSNCIP